LLATDGLRARLTFPPDLIRQPVLYRLVKVQIGPIERDVVVP